MCGLATMPDNSGSTPNGFFDKNPRFDPCDSLANAPSKEMVPPVRVRNAAGLRGFSSVAVKGLTDGRPQHQHFPEKGDVNLKHPIEAGLVTESNPPGRWSCPTRQQRTDRSLRTWLGHQLP